MMDRSTVYQRNNGFPSSLAALQDTGGEPSSDSAGTVSMTKLSPTMTTTTTTSMMNGVANATTSPPTPINGKTTTTTTATTTSSSTSTTLPFADADQDFSSSRGTATTTTTTPKKRSTSSTSSLLHHRMGISNFRMPTPKNPFSSSSSFTNRRGISHYFCPFSSQLSQHKTFAYLFVGCIIILGSIQLSLNALLFTTLQDEASGGHGSHRFAERATLQDQFDALQAQIRHLQEATQIYTRNTADPNFYPFSIRDSRRLVPTQLPSELHVWDYVDITTQNQQTSQHAALFHNAQIQAQAPCQKYDLYCYKQKILQVFQLVMEQNPNTEFFFYMEADNELCVSMVEIQRIALEHRRYFITTGIGFSGWIMRRDFMVDFLHALESYQPPPRDPKDPLSKLGPRPSEGPDPIAADFLSQNNSWAVTRQYLVSHSIQPSMGIDALTVRMPVPGQTPPAGTTVDSLAKGALAYTQRQAQRAALKDALDQARNGPPNNHENNQSKGRILAENITNTNTTSVQEQQQQRRLLQVGLTEASKNKTGLRAVGGGAAAFGMKTNQSGTTNILKKPQQGMPAKKGLEKHLPRCFEPRRSKWRISKQDHRDRFGWDYFDYDHCPNHELFPCYEGQLQELLAQDMARFNYTQLDLERQKLIAKEEERQRKRLEAIQAKKKIQEQLQQQPQ